MAIIGSIRKRMGWVLLFFVGGALLAFILGDFLTSGSSFFTGDPSTIAEVGGQKLSLQQYENKVQERFATFRIYSRQSTIDATMQDYLRDEAWDQMIRETVLNEQYKETGVAVGQDELFDMIQGKNIHPEVVRAFTDPQTGQFNPASVLSQLKQLKNNKEWSDWWMLFEQNLVREKIWEKYNTLVNKGLYLTTAEIRRDHEESQSKASIDFVVKTFNSVPDSAIKVSDADIKAYYEEHKEEYRQREEERSLEYVVFDVFPSAADTQEVVEWIHDTREDFAKAENDSLFVNRYADTPFDHNYHSKGSIAANLDSVFFDAEPGTIVGPYFENGKYLLAKLTDRRIRPDSARLQHILILAREGDTASAHIKADSLMTLLKNGADFGELAFNNSEDESSRPDSGSIGWVTEDAENIGYFDPSFRDTSFATGSKGLILLHTRYGAHIIDVQEQTQPVKQVLIAFVDRELRPSSETFRDIYTIANAFAGKSQTMESFRENAQSQNRRVAENLTAGERNIAGLESARELVRWAYNQEAGDVSDVMAFGDKFVVALLTDITEKGYIPIEKRRIELEISAKKEKKAARFTAELEKALAGKSNIEALGSAVNAEVKSAEGISFSASFIAGLGMEPAVLGYAFGAKPGQLSQPIRGNSGVFVISLKSLNPPDTQVNIPQRRTALAATLRSTTAANVIGALIEKAEVTDQRAKFY